MANSILKIAPASKFPVTHPRYLPFLIARHNRYARRTQAQQVADLRRAQSRKINVALRQIAFNPTSEVSL